MDEKVPYIAFEGEMARHGAVTTRCSVRVQTGFQRV